MAYRSEMSFLFPAVKKARKPSAPRAAAIRVGQTVRVHGQLAVIADRDDRFKAAWFVMIGGVRAPHSFSRDMIVPVA
jgi:hypothetical protein